MTGTARQNAINQAMEFFGFLPGESAAKERVYIRGAVERLYSKTFLVCPLDRSDEAGMQREFSRIECTAFYYNAHNHAIIRCPYSYLNIFGLHDYVLTEKGVEEWMTKAKYYSPMGS